MKYPYILLVLSGLVISVGCCLYFLVAAKPVDTAAAMFAAIKSNNITEAESSFGGNTCNCPIDYRSWMRYASGHEPNLAFLMGHPFTATELSFRKLPDKDIYIIPWQHPEKAEAIMRLDFSDKYRPVYLPLPLAFGKTMREKNWENFRAQPQKDSNLGFSLRLRPSIEPGLISSSPLTKAEQELPPDVQAYLRPKDCGQVIQDNGQPLPQTKLMADLPRLTSVNLKLILVRRGQISPWTVSELAFSQPTFLGTKN